MCRRCATARSKWEVAGPRRYAEVSKCLSALRSDKIKRQAEVGRCACTVAGLLLPLKIKTVVCWEGGVADSDAEAPNSAHTTNTPAPHTQTAGVDLAGCVGREELLNRIMAFVQAGGSLALGLGQDDPDLKLDMSWCPLPPQHFAAQAGHLNCLRYLLEPRQETSTHMRTCARKHTPATHAGAGRT